MFTEYIPFSAEKARDHIDSHRNRYLADLDRVPVREHQLRLPIVPIDPQYRVLLRDLSKIKNPTPNACFALPAATYHEVEEDVGVSELTREYLYRKLLANEFVGKIAVTPLDYYKNYSTECNGTPINVTNLPVVARFKLPSDEVHVSPVYQKYRGEVMWAHIDNALELLSTQSEAMPDNNLAQEAFSVLDLFSAAIGTARGAA